MALGWAYFESSGRWSGAAFGLLMWLSLLPTTAFAAAMRAAGMHDPEGVWEIAVSLALAFASGAALGKTMRARIATGLAAAALVLAMAGPVAVTNGPRAAALLLSFGAIYPLCGSVLAGLERISSSSCRSSNPLHTA